MSAETLTLIVGAILSIAFSYVPRLNTWFAAKETETKRLIMLALLLLSAGVSFGLACAGWGADFGLALTCDRAGFAGLVQAFILAVIANQSAFAISPQAPAVKRVKAAREGRADLSLGRG